MTIYKSGLESRNTIINIASSATTSGALDLDGLCFVAFIMPAAFTGTSVTFQASDDNVTYYAVNNTANVAVTIPVTASKYYLLNPSDFAGVRYLKFVSGSTEGGSRNINCITRTLV